MIACVGALLGIGFTGFASAQIAPEAMPWLIAPIGASAVLVFAVPSSPLSQPWSVIGGNTIAVVTGIIVASLVPHPITAAAIAVSAAILTMSLCRCLHAPGGAIALSAVLGGHGIASHPEMFALPVVLNSVLLVFIGRVFHRYSGHSYPHKAVAMVWTDAPPPAPGFVIEDIDKALADLGETFDVSRDDLVLLFAQAEAHAAERVKALYKSETVSP